MQDFRFFFTGGLEEVVGGAKHCLTGLGLDGPEILRVKWAINWAEKAVRAALPAEDAQAEQWELRLYFALGGWRVALQPKRGTRLALSLDILLERPDGSGGDNQAIIAISSDGVLIDL